MDWSEHDPIPAARFGRGRVAELAGIQPTCLTNWRAAGALDLPEVGKGKVRLYSVWDAVHFAIVAELSRMGVALNGPCTNLGNALATFVRWHVKRDGHLENVPTALVVYPTGDRDANGRPDWFFHVGRPPPVSHLVLNLKAVTDAVGDRFDADSSAKVFSLKEGVQASA